MIRKRSMLSLIGLAGAVAASYSMLDDQKKHQIKNRIQAISNKFQKNNQSFPIQEAGNPIDDNIDNADMVYEGSQFGVDYYNKVKQ
ncbi:hypothetical protein GGQ92_000085 [Gracilibacillus halotolerans]|uniref:Uncharacterized protein n=1 Tax=Gracilibacillus halotolerans TaxID=74386 RepID=A0A841RKP5_9BACI|nr:hypothetical protein [Gracilibacillus halotolerans]MBB6511318.1 hypothetical protein [Gracilibacillus halotolerans]